MSRIVIENIFFFLLPTLLYVVWAAFEAREWPGLGRVLSDAPLLKLFITGAMLMLASLVLLSSRSRNTPDEVYAPPVFKDGRVEPGHTVPAQK